MLLIKLEVVQEKGILTLPDKKKGKNLSPYHQNMKLILAPLNVTYQELFPLIVCDINNKECMVHRCPNCPESNTLLQDFLFHTIGDCDGDEVIEFSQWTTIDQSNLTRHKETVTEYVNIVTELLHILTVHSYTSKCQSRYLKKVKISD